jgi:hypothetical protein
MYIQVFPLFYALPEILVLHFM